MKSIFEMVWKILDDDDLDGIDIDDIMVELESAEPTLEERLEEMNLTRGEALAAARSETERFAGLAAKVGVKNLNLPYVWIDLVELCGTEGKPSEDKLELLLWLMAGGTFTDNPEYSEDEIISDWIHKSQKVREYTGYLTEFNRTANDFAKIDLTLKSSKANYHTGKQNPADTARVAESDRVFALLCDGGYADKCVNKEILRDNLESLGGLIAEIPELEPIKPLIYFQAYVRYNKKLFENQDFTINLQKILEYHEYKILKNNGKNYNQYGIYCKLYSQLKDCFPNADKPLCDMGFTAVSNLAEWWYKLPFEEPFPDRKTDRSINIPIPFSCFVRERCVTCFDESAVSKTINISAERLFKWRKRNTAIAAKIGRTAESVRFGDLKSFADNSVEFCGRLFTENKIDGLKPADHDIALALLMDELEDRFDDLLEEKIIDIIFRNRGKR